jgi:1-deoxy-D-xylulose-5-phosphate synthase
MIVAAPMNEQELRNMMYTAQLDKIQEGTRAFTIRYPRGQGVMPEWRTPLEEVEIGKGRKIKDGEELAILTLGHVGNYAVEACEELAKQDFHIGHYDMRFVKPLDEEMLHEIFQKFDRIITVEDGCLQGGFGSAVIEFMTDHGYTSRIKRLGIPDRIVEHGEPHELHRECAFDTAGIVRTAQDMIAVDVKLSL